MGGIFKNHTSIFEFFDSRRPEFHVSIYLLSHYRDELFDHFSNSEREILERTESDLKKEEKGIGLIIGSGVTLLH